MGDSDKQVIDQLPVKRYVRHTTPIYAHSDPYKAIGAPVINSRSHDPFDFDQTDDVKYPRSVTFTFDNPEDEERYERANGKRHDRRARLRALNKSSPAIFHPNAPMFSDYNFRQFAESFGHGGLMPDNLPMSRPLNIPPDPPQNFYAGEWKSTDMAPICNGIHPANNNHDKLDASEYAISFLNKEREMKLKQLIRANWQFRRCSVYWLTMEASDDKFYEALVLVSIDQKEKVLKFIRPAKYYPEIPAHLHHLIGPPPGEEPLTQFPQPDLLF